MTDEKKEVKKWQESADLYNHLKMKYDIESGDSFVCLNTQEGLLDGIRLLKGQKFKVLNRTKDDWGRSYWDIDIDGKTIKISSEVLENSEEFKHEPKTNLFRFVKALYNVSKLWRKREWGKVINFWKRHKLDIQWSIGIVLIVIVPIVLYIISS